jgi:hypothetical protein
MIIKLVFSLFFVLLCNLTNAQKEFNKKGDFLIYWGWNRTAFSNSDINSMELIIISHFIE